MKKLILLLLLITGQVCAFSQKTEEYSNPILAGFYPDPSICRVGNDYYLVNSTFVYTPGLPVFHSTDLVNWEQLGNAVDRPDQLNITGEVSRGLYAPDISYHNGIFYIVCTSIDKGSFVITAKDPAGPWSNLTWLEGINGIDPALFFDNNDKAYIIYNSVPPGNKPLWDGHRTICIRDFDYTALKTGKEETLLVDGGTDITKKPVWIEGPHLYHINDWYYLLCAEGGTGDNHSEVIFRSKSPLGPFVSYEGNPILTQRHLNQNRAYPITTTGHADIIETQNGQWYAVFLGCRPYDGAHYNIGRETFLAPVRWTNDGWPVITSGKEEIKHLYPVPQIALAGRQQIPAQRPNAIGGSNTRQDSRYNGNFFYINDFTDSFPDKRFIFLRTVTQPWYQVKDGWLHITARPETISGGGNPSYVGFRQQQHWCTAMTTVKFDAAAENEKAGLAIFQNEHHYYFLCRSVENGKPVVQLYKSTPTDAMELLASHQLPAGTDKLKLVIEQQKTVYKIRYKTTDEQWHQFPDVDARFLSTQTAGGFVGCTFGLYATSQGKPSASIASFDEFEYNNFSKKLQ